MTDREAFEAWWVSQWPDKELGLAALRKGDGGYVGRDWKVWQASRKQALEELRESLSWIADRAHSAHMSKSKDIDDWDEDMELIAWKANEALGTLSKAESK